MSILHAMTHEELDGMIKRRDAEITRLRAAMAKAIHQLRNVTTLYAPAGHGIAEARAFLAAYDAEAE